MQFDISKGVKIIGSLRGTQTKWKVNNYYAKADLVGYEGMAEELTSLFIRKFVTEACVEYRAVTLYNTITGLFRGTGCISTNYNERGYIECNLVQYIEEVGITESEVLNTHGETRWALFEQVLSEEELVYLLRLMQIDALILNDDRHLLNISFLCFPGVRMFTPIYDNGASLFSDETLYSYKRSFNENRKKVMNRTLDIGYGDTIRFLQKKGVPLLTFNKQSVIQFVLGYTSKAYTNIQVNRCKETLLTQLRQTEGILWQSV